MNKILVYIGFVCAAMVTIHCGSVKQTSEPSITRPYNIVLIVADDLGRNDLGCYGNSFIETPNLDQLAAEGLQFMNAYTAAPLCSPTRASIITGNNPARINLTEHLHGYSGPGKGQKLVTPRIENGLPAALITIPEQLNGAGFTTAHFGKWHLGSGASSPAAQGFQTVYGGGAEGLPKTFFYPFFNGRPYPDLLADTKEGDYLDDALTEKAIGFINENKSKLFFVELNFYAPHVPIEGKKELVEKYGRKREAKGYQGLPEDEYAAMVDNIDYNVGRVMRYLKQADLDQHTMVLFVSDNGGLDVQEVPAFAKHTPPTSNSPLRGGKGYLYEGGIKAPWIVWIPSVVKKGRKDSTLVTTDDIFNTCMSLAKLNHQSADGISLWPVFNGGKLRTRNFYLHFPHYSPQHGKPGAVVRQGDYKLIEWYEDGQLELYNLAIDQSERNNLVHTYPELVREMKTSLDNWKKEVGAKPVMPNPMYKPD